MTLKIEGCTEEESQVLFKNFNPLWSNGMQFDLFPEGNLNDFGRIFIAGFRAAPRISEEAQAIIEAAQYWGTSGARSFTSDPHQARLIKALSDYEATGESVDTKELEREVERTKTILADHVATLGHNQNTEEKFAAAYREARKALADATAPKLETRLEAAEKVCEFMAHSDFKAWLPLRTLLDNWEAAKAR